MIIFEKHYVTSWGNLTKQERSGVSFINVESLFNKFNQPQWKWPDYPNGKPIYSPQPYTPEQKEQLRKGYCQAEIRKNYSAEDEIKILRENLINLSKGQGDTREFSDYNSVIKKVIEESKKRDYQIEVCNDTVTRDIDKD